MVTITEEYINSKAVNADSLKNGKSLVQKGKFVKLLKDKDETIIFGECEGSGSSNYMASADFIKEDSPVFRCTCPSRQFPCKHVIGLMFANVMGKQFEIGEIPEDIKRKREKLDKKSEEPEEEVEKKVKPKKSSNVDAVKKKALLQIEGITIIRKIVDSILLNGIASLKKLNRNEIEKQLKEIGNYYIPGLQSMIREFYDTINEFQEADEHKKYAAATEKLIKINSLCKKGTETLDKITKGEELTLQDMGIEEQLGRVWQLGELKERGLMQNNVELIQLSFEMIVNRSEKEFIDTGVWLNLTNGEIIKTQNFRPFKAINYIKDEDSFYKVATVKELFIYPQEMNKRVRWDSIETRECTTGDYKNIVKLAKDNYTSLSKEIKNYLKNPLSEKEPYSLIKYIRTGRNVEGMFIETPDGIKIGIRESENGVQTSYFLNYISIDEELPKAMLVKFIPDLTDGNLYCQPKSIITEDEIIRLSY